MCTLSPKIRQQPHFRSLRVCEPAGPRSTRRPDGVVGSRSKLDAGLPRLQRRQRRAGVVVAPEPAAKAKAGLAEKVRAQQEKEDAARKELMDKISDELTLPPSEGTFDEYRTKVRRPHVSAPC